MILPSWLVAVSKPHIHYARDHYWKYLIHNLCFSASKARGFIGFIGVKWNWNRAQASSQQKENKAWKHCMAASQGMLHHAVVSLLLWQWPKNHLHSGLWVGLLKLELCHNSDTQVLPAAVTCREQDVAGGAPSLWAPAWEPQQRWGFVEWHNGHGGPWAPSPALPLWAAGNKRKEGGWVHVRNFSTSQ